MPERSERNDKNDEKRVTEKLRTQAERDTLTGLYNKGTLQILASRYIEETVAEQVTGLMIIDVDNFKQINDTYGHLTGDVLLSDIARTLKTMFRQSDIIGRIGGDEFAVLVRDCSQVDEIQKKAERVLKDFQAIAGQQDFVNKLSCSIGISITPDDGHSFIELYKKADIALYSAKTQGKNRFAFYQGALEAVYGELEYIEKRTIIGKDIDSDNSKGNIRSWLTNYVFQMLYDSVDIETALPLIFEIVGRQFDVSRVYVFEDALDGSHSSKTYEWCGGDAQMKTKSINSISYTEYKDYYRHFDEDGIFYCKDVSHLPGSLGEMLTEKGIKSLLQCAIRDNGVNCGFVGFDECRNNRYWNQEQINILIMVSEIITVFLLKARTQNKMMQMLEGLKNILDCQEQWIYVVEPETYRILYANEKTFSLIPELKLGSHCYQSFFDAEHPCEECPTRAMKDCEMVEEVIFSALLEKQILATVTKITWSENRPVYLISCRIKEDTVR